MPDDPRYWGIYQSQGELKNYTVVEYFGGLEGGWIETAICLQPPVIPQW